jgi:putative transposase
LPRGKQGPGPPLRRPVDGRGISASTFYRRTRQFAGMAVAETRRPKQLEEEDRKLELLILDLN